MKSESLSCKALLRIVFVAAMSLGLAGVASAAVFMPPAGQKLIVIGQDVGSIATYVSAVGQTPGGVTGYTGINNLGGFTTNGDWGAGINNAQTLANTYPNSALVLGISLNGQATAFANGAYDANLDTLINTLKSWNRPVFLRWGYEVEGTWNAHPPADFRAGWIKVWNRIRALGAQDHIAMVWQTATYCPDGISVSQTLDWYPGDQYVDWMGMSYFTPQDCSWGEIDDMIALARSHAKPLLIAEATPQRYDIGSLTYSTDAAFGNNKQARSAQQIWNEWFANLFNVINANSDVIKGLAYINADWDSQWKWNPTDGIGPVEGYWGDSRVQAQSLIRTNWLSEMNSNGWLSGGSTLFATLGFGPGGGTDTQAPTVPANFTVTGTDSNSITLAWDAATDDTGVASYGVYRGATLVGSPASTSFVDSGLAANTTYSYTVRACDAAGNCSAQSAAVSGTTGAPPTGGDAQGIEVSGGTATLYFNDAGWTGSWNYLCLGEHCVSGVKVGTRWQRTISEQAIVVGGSYQIQIKIQNAASSGGQYISPMTTVVAAAAGGGGGTDTQAPTVPGNLSVTGTGSNSIALAWSASSDNVSVTKYDVYRGGVLVGSPTGTSLNDTGLAASTTYAYTVRACDAAGNCSAQSAAVNGTTTAPPTGGGEQGIEVSGGTATLYFNDAGWTGSWNYLCLGEYCVSGTKVGTRWQRTISEQAIVVGSSYQIQIKIQNAASSGGQYISPMTTVTAGGG